MRKKNFPFDRCEEELPFNRVLSRSCNYMLIIALVPKVGPKAAENSAGH